MFAKRFFFFKPRLEICLCYHPLLHDTIFTVHWTLEGFLDPTSHKSHTLHLNFQLSLLMSLHLLPNFHHHAFPIFFFPLQPLECQINDHVVWKIFSLRSLGKFKSVISWLLSLPNDLYRGFYGQLTVRTPKLKWLLAHYLHHGIMEHKQTFGNWKSQWAKVNGLKSNNLDLIQFGEQTLNWN